MEKPALYPQDERREYVTVANSHGECKGGHVVEGCKVYTTLELVIAILPEVRFKRRFDPTTGYKELAISLISESTI